MMQSMMHNNGPQWTRTETKVLREWIKADSKKRSLGAHVHCCDCCYDRNCPCMVYILCSMLAVTSIVLFIVFCTQIIVPYNNASKFEPGECTTRSTRDTLRDVKCCHEKDECYSFMCVEVLVTLMTPGGMQVNTVLYQDLETLEAKRCSYRPACDISPYITKLHIEQFNRFYGATGKVFPCMYNRRSPLEVVIMVTTGRVWQSHVVTHVTVWPLVLIFVSLLTLTITFFICGCQPYVWPSRPSPELRLEAYQRDRGEKAVKQQKSLASREEEAFRKFYMMQGMPVPPSSNLDTSQDGSLLHSPSELQAILDKSV